MATYAYVAVDKNGKDKKGTMDAQNRDKVISFLKTEGLLPIEVKEVGALNKDIEINIGGNPKPRDLSVFCRQFVSMINAGVTINDALGMLAEQTENKKLAKGIANVQADIEKGETLANAMKKEKVFPDMLVNMAAAGETSGSLDVAFSRMAVQFEKTAKINGLVQKAAVYPMVVAVVAIVVVIVMLVKIIPSYQDMFADLGTELPAITKMVVAMSDFMIAYWYVLIAAVIAIAVGFKYFSKTDLGQMTLGRIQYKIPVFGKLTIKTASSQFSRTLSTLMSAGVPMIEALDIVGNTMNNALFRRAVLEAKEDVAKGIPLSEPIKRCGLFPPMVHHMIKIGETSGDVSSMLERLADYYDEEVEMTTQTVMAALEPMIIIVLAAIVGILVAAIMAPMVSMYSALDSL